MLLRLVLLIIAVFCVALGVRLLLFARLERHRRQEELDEAAYQDKLANERKEGRR